MLVQEFWDANHREQQLPARRPPVRWPPPLEASYKANFDAAIFDGTSFVGIGVVFRDHSGSIISTLSQRIESFHLVELAETLTAGRAVMLARELSLFDVIFEGDCLRVVQALRCFGHCNTLFGQVIEESKRLGCSL